MVMRRGCRFPDLGLAVVATLFGAVGCDAPAVAQAAAPEVRPAKLPGAGDVSAPVRVEPLPAEEFAQVLEGLEGAATAVAARDGARALEITATLTAEPGTELWFILGAIEGRANLLLGDFAAAVQALEPRVEHRKLARSFPPDVLGVELAQAYLGLASQPENKPADLDDLLAGAIRHLRRLGTREPLRNGAQMRVLQAQLSAKLSGRGGARQAATALEKVLRDYPRHPQRGQLWLEHALALERSGRHRDAVAELRTIVVERNGEPEGLAAWAELGRMAEEDGTTVPPLSAAERLASATACRHNRRVELSRELLEGLIAAADTPESIRKLAEQARPVTAAKQRDYAACADDLRARWEPNHPRGLRGDLLKCLERAGLYDEAVDVWLGEAKRAKRTSHRAHAHWEAFEVAFRGGKYTRAMELLGDYEKIGKAHRQTRAWLRPYLAYRLGDAAAAISGFGEYERTYRRDRLRARYFRGKLLVRAADKDERAEGEALLTQVAQADALGYYGLMARQRLLDAQLDPPPAPELEPVAEELDPPRRAEAQGILDVLAAKYGPAWPPVERARQLYQAGYNDEARREVRVAVQAMLTKGRRAGGVRNEDILVGLAWKSAWKYPRVAPTKAGRKTLRDRDAVEELRVGLRQVAFALHEPHTYLRLSSAKDAPWRSRWSVRAFRPAVEREARLRNIDPKHLWALMYTESRFRPHVVSPVGARGALQIMPWTAHQLAERLGETDEGRFFDTDRLFDIDTNAHLAAYYVAELLAKFHGQAPMAYASYNGGPSNVSRWLTAKASGGKALELDAFIEEIPFVESYRYTKRVMEIHATYGLLYEGELPRWGNSVDPVFEDNIDF